MLRRKDFIGRDGERFSLLLDEDGVPDFWVTLYLTSELRYTKQGTALSEIGHLMHLRLFEVVYGDFADRFVQRSQQASFAGQPGSQLMTTSEIGQLVRHCKVTVKEARRAIEDLQKSGKKVVSLSAARAGNGVPAQTVSTLQVRNRMTTAANYLAFIAESALRNTPNFAQCLVAIQVMKTSILKKRPKKHSKKNSVKAAPPEVFEEVMRSVHPLSENNPFTMSIRQRNWIMFSILYETGMRMGELLQLKVKDVDDLSNVISIRRRHNDLEDKYRKIEPNAKTLERDLPISSGLADEIRTYRIRERRNVSASRKHPFLFISHKGPSAGNPLTKSQFSRIVRKVATDKQLAEFIGHHGIKVDRDVAPHGFRHNANWRLSDRIDTLNRAAREDGRFDDIISPKKESDLRMQINGHTSRSSSDVYNERHTKLKAQELLRKQHEDIDRMLGEWSE